jgi:hypothetical protein
MFKERDGVYAEIAENAEFAEVRGGMVSQQVDPPPTPGGFSQRVRKRLKIKGLSFCRVQKSAQAFERKEDSSETPWNVPDRDLRSTIVVELRFEGPESVPGIRMPDWKSRTRRGVEVAARMGSNYQRPW